MDLLEVLLHSIEHSTRTRETCLKELADTSYIPELSYNLTNHISGENTQEHLFYDPNCSEFSRLQEIARGIIDGRRRFFDGMFRSELDIKDMKRVLGRSFRADELISVADAMIYLGRKYEGSEEGIQVAERVEHLWLSSAAREEFLTSLSTLYEDYARLCKKALDSCFPQSSTLQ